jgi:hypothetical protein
VQTYDDEHGLGQDIALDRRGPMSANSMSDDLPRTLRREREARGLNGNAERGNAGFGFAAPQSSVASTPAYVPEPARGERVVMEASTVTDIRIPFFRLMMFSFKLVFAAIPALILFFGLLWFAGHLLMTYAPWLVKLQILIRVP